MGSIPRNNTVVHMEITSMLVQVKEAPDADVTEVL